MGAYNLQQRGRVRKVAACGAFASVPTLHALVKIRSAYSASKSQPHPQSELISEQRRFDKPLAWWAGSGSGLAPRPLPLFTQ
jgi:hypothetical protein